MGEGKACLSSSCATKGLLVHRRQRHLLDGLGSLLASLGSLVEGLDLLLAGLCFLRQALIGQARLEQSCRAQRWVTTPGRAG